MKSTLGIFSFVVLSILLIGSVSALITIDSQWNDGSQNLVVDQSGSASFDVYFVSYDSPMDVGVKLYNSDGEVVETFIASTTDSHFFENEYNIPSDLEAGDYEVLVSGSDSAGDREEVKLTLRVNIQNSGDNINHRPAINSNPLKEVKEGRDYSYQVVASDEDGDALTYQMVNGPQWLSIDENTGLVSGVAPQIEEDIAYNVELNVLDGNDGDTWQIYNLIVRNVVEDDGGEDTDGTEDNNPPIIISTPITEVKEGRDYSYQVVATDEDSDVLSYHLIFNIPNWISIDENTGLVSGVAPEVTEDTEFEVTVVAYDGEFHNIQKYNVVVENVRDNKDSNDKKKKTINVDEYYTEKYLAQFNPINLDEDEVDSSKEESKVLGRILLALAILVFVLLVLIVIFLLARLD